MMHNSMKNRFLFLLIIVSVTNIVFSQKSSDRLSTGFRMGLEMGYFDLNEELHSEAFFNNALLNFNGGMIIN